MERDKKDIVITGESLLMDIQEAFSGYYPFLMVEFFRNDKHLPTPGFVKIDPGTYLKALTNIRASRIIDIGRLRTVSEVLYEMTGYTGAIVRICRKSGNVWSAVSLTAGWTLERQNTAGEYISGIMAAPPARL